MAMEPLSLCNLFFKKPHFSTFWHMADTLTFFETHLKYNQVTCTFLYICISCIFSQSIDQEMSTEYLLTTLLESCQSWYTGCPMSFDFQVTWSKVKVKMLVFV